MKLAILASLVVLAFSEDSALDTKILVSIPQGELSKEIASMKLELEKMNSAIAKGVEREEKHYEQLKKALEKNQVQPKEIQTAAPSAPALAPSASAATATSTPEQTTSLRIIMNNGTAGSSSHWSFYSAAHAFDHGGFMWINKNNQFPALVWMRFPTSHRLAKIGFTVNTYHPEYSPKRFSVIGSDDCSKWNTLLSVTSPGVFVSQVVKTWDIPLENRVYYACIGIDWPVPGKGDRHARIADITMWEQV